jgi:hypothetical protein
VEPLLIFGEKKKKSKDVLPWLVRREKGNEGYEGYSGFKYFSTFTVSANIGYAIVNIQIHFNSRLFYIHLIGLNSPFGRTIGQKYNFYLIGRKRNKILRRTLS